MNVTGPVGIPAPGATALTVAVNVTGRTVTAGLAPETSVVVVEALVMVSVSMAVLAATVALPS